MKCRNDVHADNRVMLRKLQDALDKYGLTINHVNPKFRGPLARMKNHPKFCPFCLKEIP